MGKKKKKKFKQAALNKKYLKKAIIEIFQENPKKVLNYKIIASQLNIKDMATKALINVALEELAESEALEIISKGKYKLKARIGHITGKVQLTSRGFGYVISDEIEEDVFVSQINLNHALEGDSVKVDLFAHHKGRQPEGEVTEILERAKTTFVGTVQRTSKFAFLVPASGASYDIFIPLENIHGAKDGQKAIARITEWPKGAKNPFGEIIDVLGDAGDNNTEMHAILAEFDLPYKFPPKVEQAADRIGTIISEEEINNRRDFRSITTFTIDPADAKDFDDALSIQKLDNGNWEVGVHIADVSHYVLPKTILEKEAYKRATSVYLVDRVVPMLPEKLSNGVCSLRPNEDKLTFSAVFELNHKAEVIKQWFGRTIIHSDRRFSYEEAQVIIETGEGDFKDEILTLHKLAQNLRSDRFKHGSIAFERLEVKFNINEEGKPLSVYFKESKEANQLIEEFMLLANKKVAEYIGALEEEKKTKTFVYRIHDKPDPEKLDNFNHFIKKYGYGIQITTPKTISKSMNQLLSEVLGKKEQNVIETLAIRTMAKAEYSTRNIGHYGLHFNNYTHFTSPIRRYPDVMVHRLLARYLDNKRSVLAEKYEEMCKHSSDMEAKAANAERASIKYKQVEFMSDKIGEIYEGVISGVTDWGIYVELIDSKCEGMVPLRDLDDDYYEFDERNYCIKGRRTHKKYQLGDEVNIQIVKANLERKQLDFRLIEE